MKLSLISALSKNNVIGKNNQLPWHLPADLQHFKSLTLNKPIIMGRKTFDSIGKPLPKRRNIIITRNAQFHADGVELFLNLEDALQAVKNEPEVMIIGGATLYAETIERADYLYLTRVHTTIDGDTFFPPWDKKQWHCISEEKHAPDEKNVYSFTFETWKRG